MAQNPLNGFLVLALAAALTACAGKSISTADAPVQIKGQHDITAALIDKTFYGRYLSDRGRWSEYFSKNGESAYREGHKTCTGHWEISQDTACFTYDLGEPNCFTVWQAGSNMLFVSDGQDPKDQDLVVADRIVAGDPESMMGDRDPTCR